MIEMKTTMGDIVLELDPAKAPKTVANFVEYAKSGFYDGTIFHRVIETFVIQGGGLDATMKEKETRAPIENEANNGLSNKAFTICMARTNDPNSATSQFFINTKDNPNLDYKGPSQPGYAVFGKVTQGEDVIKKIAAVKTTRKGYFDDVPETPVVIEKVSVK